MVSRWTDFLNLDGEKESRNRDEEFEDTIKSKKELMEIWEKGWEVLFVDSSYFRPKEVDLLIGDPNKAKEKLGWISDMT